MDWIPRYWALIILSVIYRVAGGICLVITLLSVFAFASVAQDVEQPIPFPTLPPFPELPDFSILEIPEFNLEQPPQLPNIDARQITAALGRFAAIYILVFGLASSLGIYALGQFLVLMIDHEENMRLTADGLAQRVRR